MQWTELCPSQISYIEALTPNVHLEDEASKEVVIVKCGCKGVPGLIGLMSLEEETPEITCFFSTLRAQ